MEKKNKAIAMIRISDIVRDKEFQVRFGLNKKNLTELTNMYRRGNRLDPVALANVGGVLILVDGWHRVRACEVAEQAFIEAEIVEATKEEALEKAYQANMKHGLPLGSKELIKIFKRYVKNKMYKKSNGRYKSLREIAEDFCNRRSHNTIRTWMKKYFRKIYERHYQQEGEGNVRSKGHKPFYVTVEEKTFFGKATQALEQASAMFKGVTNTEERGILIYHMEKTLRDMKEGGAWKPYEENEDF